MRQLSAKLGAHWVRVGSAKAIALRVDSQHFLVTTVT